ncbi:MULTISPECIES: Crp/Fnr family transcriptional regulator [Chryseobacterium]|uniref:Anaerobic aromatic degradation regulator n=1 Tax=Chryseobacterium balustinum TaxID=246 RepID=A0AAX2IS31_9FLAO|nr:MULTISPECIES: Crp/Fnr family transcriptional regulator [Chryseobacterium]AZB28464.1 Crp/Fnr family transcriptional regulator [Chryseobacterium balustinum]MDY0933320.1 Crp/Fnr family transcriptional regulator [Chryseobacterium sp. CFBP8996]SKC13065.1 cAMP-binding domain of CRP or a regulatory subunit of cAMP-dependent protein kinases [Chryseobacterium balustinum]SQA92542.1 Anaerobic aromatic degradation regulator [Chryseobacterium balustinum]
MLVDIELLKSYGGITETFSSSDIIFNEDDVPKYYYQIISGFVKLNHIDEDGKELIQSILSDGQSVCELLLFIDENYPVNAVAISKCTIIKTPKQKFLLLLDEHHKSATDVRKFISERLYHKFIMMQNNASKHSHERIKGILVYFKSLSDDQTQYSYEVPLTRQQLASITGLRIETVIRAVKKMESEKFLKIKNRKIYF